jgi:hypothetical protein
MLPQEIRFLIPIDRIGKLDILGRGGIRDINPTIYL